MYEWIIISSAIIGGFIGGFLASFLFGDEEEDERCEK